MRQSAGKMFIRVFLKSLFIVIILFGVGMLSYQTVMHFWKAPDNDSIYAFKQQQVPESITEPTLDDISKNLIFSVNEETGEINKILLEIFQCENKKLYYITIPIRTQFTMSDSLYQKLILVDPAVPQIFKLSSITKYFDKAAVYDYGVLIVEDMLGIDISYYTAIGQSVYETMFTTETLDSEKASLEVGQDSALPDEAMSEVSSTRMVPKEVFSEDYDVFLKTIKTAEELSNYIEDTYPSVQSNLSLSEKMEYFDSYCKTPRGNIFFELISGVDKNSAYILDKDLVTRQLAKCTVGTEEDKELD